MGKVICVCNQKGGVAKSSTVLNLGVALSGKGKKVLLIDTDSQGSLTASLRNTESGEEGYHDPDELDFTLATVLGKLIRDEEIDPEEGIIHHKEGIDLMPGNIELASLEVSMVNLFGRERFLKMYVDRIKGMYDFVIVDTNPSLGMLTINALTASDSIIIPLQASYLPVKALQQLIRTVNLVKRQLNAKLEIEGILLTMVDSRTSYAKDICEMVRSTYGEMIRIFRENIPRTVRMEEASAEGVSIFTHDKNGKAAKAYQSLAEEVLSDAK